MKTLVQIEEEHRNYIMEAVEKAGSEKALSLMLGTEPSYVSKALGRR